METPCLAHSYFESVADNYRHLTKSWLWSAVKGRELRRMMALVPRTGGGPLRALELGAGAGYYSEALSRIPGLQLCALDFSPKMLAHHSSPGEKVLADIENLPDSLRERTFDLIFSAGTFEFLLDPERVLAQLSRMQPAGAALVLTLPSRSVLTRTYCWFHGRRGLKIRRYSAEDIAELARAAGYRVGQVRPVPPFNHGVQLIKR